MFALGSAVWVVNGFFMFLPSLEVMSETNEEAIGWTAFVGGSLFEIGSYLMVLEALNRKHEAPTINMYQRWAGPGQSSPVQSSSVFGPKNIVGTGLD